MMQLAPIATFTAALVALFKEDFVKLWRRPKLTLRLLLQLPDSSPVATVVSWREVTTVTWTGNVYYFRFWFENTGTWPAERVQVNLRSIRNRPGDGKLGTARQFLPMNLRWANFPFDKPVLFETLNPKMGKHCDLGSVSPPANKSEKPLPGMKDGESTFNLATEVFPNDNSQRLPPGKYRLEILVAAQNVRPKAFNVDVDWSGKFEDSVERMFSDSIAVRISN
jgi:hypothetical protein